MDIEDLISLALVAVAIALAPLYFAAMVIWTVASYVYRGIVYLINRRSQS